jgi:multiple sugar transport system permease protein
MSFAYSLERNKMRAGAAMAAPSVLLLLAFVVYPIVSSLVMSFTDWNLLTNRSSFVGFGNYAKAFADGRFMNAFVNTLAFTAAYVPLLALASLLLALALDAGGRGSGLFQTVFFLPAVTSVAILSIVWRFLLDPDIGLVMSWMRGMGFKTFDLLRDPGRAMGTIVGISLWRWAGFNMVILLGGLKTVPRELGEAASIDGAGPARRFFGITLPLLLPSLSFVVVTNLISSFQVFDQVYVMTKGGPMFKTETLVYYAYYKGFNLFEMGYASAMTFVLFLVILVFTLAQLKSYAQAERDRGFSS